MPARPRREIPAFRRARGRYCAFLDADDVMLPDRLMAQAELLDAEPDLALVHTDLMTFNDNGMIHRDATGVLRSAAAGWCWIGCCSTISSRPPRSWLESECVLEAGLFDVGRRDFRMTSSCGSAWPRVGRSVTSIVRCVKYRRRPGVVSDDKLATAQWMLWR